MYRQPLRKPILSPIQPKEVVKPDLHKSIRDMQALVLALAGTMERNIEDINSRIDGLNYAIERVREEAGSSDSSLREELKKKLESELVLEINRAELKGDPGKDAEPEPINYSYIIDEVVKLIPPPVPGNPGKDAVAPTIDYALIIDTVLKRIKVPKPMVDYAYIISMLPKPQEIDTKDLIEQVLEEMMSGKKIEMKHIKGLEDTHRSLRNAPKAIMHGGGDTVRAGTNITATRNSDGTTTISSTIAGFSTLTATETPNGSITVFTFSAATAKPSFIMSDNVIMRDTTSSGTVNWTWNAGTKKATMTIPPIDDIIAII